jgi:predicted metal-dependent hydrolase
MRTSLAAIREFVSRRGAWIVKIWARFDGQSPAPGQSYEDGAAFLFQGVQYRLALEREPEVSVHVRGGLLVVTTPDVPSSANLVKLVDAWYRERAVEIFRERLIVCHSRMQPGAVESPPLVIRPMTSRWGSYSYRTRRINLNLNLIKVPQACLDYVIIHELCHVTVRHHGPAFWRLVGRHCPDYATLRRQLRAFVSALH